MVTPGATANISIELQVTEKRPATIAVKTQLPGARLYVDDVLVGVTPLDISKLPVQPGSRRVELRRDGYVTAAKTLALVEGAEAEVTLEPQEDASAIARSGETLKLELAQPDAAIYIDGNLRDVGSQAVRLAEGMHFVRMERTGHAPVEQQLVVPSGGTITVPFDLPLMPETRARKLDEAESDRTTGLALTVVGGALAAAGIAVLIWNGVAHAPTVADKEQLHDTCLAGLTSGATTDEQCLPLGVDAGDTRNLVDGLYAGGAVGLGLGVAGLVTGIVYLATGDDPEIFQIHLDNELATLHFEPGFVGVTGRF